MKQVFFAILFGFVATIALPGCGDSGPTNVTEDADEQALADYDRMIAEEEAAMNAEMEGNLDQ